MTSKSELLRIAAELKSTADRIIDLAKEDDKEESDEEDSSHESPASSSKGDHAVIGAILRKKLGK